MRIEVEKERCIGSGQCNLIAPTVFDQDDDGIVVLLTERPPSGEHDHVHEAAQVCPAQAIRVVD